MLQERSYYQEDQSPILNLFNCNSEINSSHFTAMRVLALLLGHRGESSTEGRGYYELARLVNLFAEVFDNVRDLSITLNRLVNAQLVEVNTRSTKTASGASHIRITASGWYYFNELSHAFAYLDLILQDTPLNYKTLQYQFCKSVYEVNNLTDRDFEKMERMQVRFNRTEQFIGYLTKKRIMNIMLLI